MAPVGGGVHGDQRASSPRHRLAPFATQDLPAWLQQRGLPTWWRIAQFDAGAAQPSRIAVCGPHPDGGWDGCETIRLLRVTGVPPNGLVRENADRMLRDLDAEAITTYTLTAPPIAGVCVVGSSGYFGVAGRRLWLQGHHYVDISQPTHTLVLSCDEYV